MNPNVGSRNSSRNGGSIRSFESATPERLYRVWPGNNVFHRQCDNYPLLYNRQRFLCGGRLVFGYDASSLYLTTFLIGAPAVTFCVRMIMRLESADPVFGFTVLITAMILTFLVFMFLYMTSVGDPGIIPRNLMPPEDAELGMPSVSFAARRSFRAPRMKDVQINGYTIRVKFCDTCNLYRPPRASHCSICNNCVQRFDHHCPWVGQCIGLRNYRTFIFFISSATLLCIYVFVFSLINLLHNGQNIWHTMSDDVLSVILACYCFIVIWFVGGLTVFHFYLLCTNQTTYENFRSRYDRKKNPYNMGLIHNLKQVFLKRVPPSQINFREWVLVQEDVGSECSSSYHGGYDSEMSKTLNRATSMATDINHQQKKPQENQSHR